MSFSNTKHRSLFRSIMDMKCPKCREGDLFINNTLSFQKPFDMPKQCPNCKLNYMPEPGFYFGAMFISYGVSIVFSLSLCLSLVFYFEWSVNAAMALLIFISVLSYIWVFKISRSLWIHFIIKFVPTSQLHKID